MYGIHHDDYWVAQSNCVDNTLTAFNAQKLTIVERIAFYFLIELRSNRLQSHEWNAKLSWKFRIWIEVVKWTLSADVVNVEEVEIKCRRTFHVKETKNFDLKIENCRFTSVMIFRAPVWCRSHQISQTTETTTNKENRTFIRIEHNQNVYYRLWLSCQSKLLSESVWNCASTTMCLCICVSSCVRSYVHILFTYSRQINLIFNLEANN